MSATLVNIDKVFKAAKQAPHPDLYIEAFKERHVIPRVMNGEHLHLEAFGLVECINPDEKCWNGVRDARH